MSPANVFYPIPPATEDEAAESARDLLGRLNVIGDSLSITSRVLGCSAESMNYLDGDALYELSSLLWLLGRDVQASADMLDTIEVVRSRAEKTREERTTKKR
jgi:hypothetical protein